MTLPISGIRRRGETRRGVARRSMLLRVSHISLFSRYGVRCAAECESDWRKKKNVSSAKVERGIAHCVRQSQRLEPRPRRRPAGRREILSASSRIAKDTNLVGHAIVGRAIVDYSRSNGGTREVHGIPPTPRVPRHGWSLWRSHQISIDCIYSVITPGVLLRVVRLGEKKICICPLADDVSQSCKRLPTMSEQQSGGVPMKYSYIL